MKNRTFRAYRSLLAGAALIVSVPGAPRAQAPATGPLTLRLPMSTRAAALGNAWVAGRDEDVLFYNPAQLIGTRTGFNVTHTRYGSKAATGGFASMYAGGPWSLTLGWGVHVAYYSVAGDAAYPFTPDVLSHDGPVDVVGSLATIGAGIVFKGFRVGVSGKYAADHVIESPNGATISAGTRDAYLLDAGLARNVLGGVAALAVQNIGAAPTDGGRTLESPLQAALGWSMGRAVGEFDLGVTGQITGRTGWIAPGAGVELGYAWIEGFSAAARLGVRRPDSDGEQPLAIGGVFTGDRLSLEYALQFFDSGNHAHRMTLRWR